MVGAGVLAAAGLFQWSALKYRCLDQCRSPFGFVSSRWHGRSPAREAFRIGVDHGLFCVGCCWALMLMMFVVGTGSIGWMLALAAVMAAEKNLSWGRRLATPVGVAASRLVGGHRRRQRLSGGALSEPGRGPLSQRCNAATSRAALFVASRVESSHNSRLSILPRGALRPAAASALRAKGVCARWRSPDGVPSP